MRRYNEAMSDDARPPDREIWFPAKRYGWGWGFPCKWQGWVFLLVWLAAMAGGTIILLTMLRAWPPAVSIAVYMAWTWVMVAVLIAVCWRKGERPRWRWGG